MTMCKWKDKAHKLCVDMCADGCWREKQSKFKPDQDNARETVLKEYFRLVDLYHAADLLFLEHEDVDDEDTFHFYWTKVTKAHNHLQDYKLKHKISHTELTQATAGVKVGSVAEVVRIGGELLEGKYAP